MIYVVKMSGSNCYKIGYTNGATPDSRIASLQTACPYKLELIGIIEGGTEKDEQMLQSQFIASKTNGGDEWFALSDEQINQLTTYLEELRNGYNNYQRPTVGSATFDVRPLRGRQQHPITKRGEDVPDRRSPLDNARHQPVFPLMRRK